MQCAIDLGAAEPDHLFVPADYRIPPLSFFEEGIPEWVHDLPAGPLSMGAFNCDGQFYSLMGEDGVAFTTRYPGIDAPTAPGATSYYMNERVENALAVRDADGEIVYISAGPIGFGHSPDDIEWESDLFLWHDRVGLDGMERALIRGRLYVEGNIVYTVGALQGDVTNGEAYAISQAEVSPEFALIDDGPGTPGHLEYVTLSIVSQGNTRTSASSTARAEVGMLRRVRANIERTTDAEEAAMDKEFENRLAALEAAATERACACQGEQAEVDEIPTDERVEALEASVRGLRVRAGVVKAEHEAMIALMMAQNSQDAGIERAGMELNSQRRGALASAIYGEHDGYTEIEEGEGDSGLVWSEVFYDDHDDNYVYMRRYVGGDFDAVYRQAYQVGSNDLSVSLVGELEAVAVDTRYVTV